MGRYSKKQLTEMVHSEDADLRIKAARHGCGLEVLVGDKHAGVRAAVARQGYGLETLVNDPNPSVRATVARQGYGLETLTLNDRLRNAAERQSMNQNHTQQISLFGKQDFDRSG